LDDIAASKARFSRRAIRPDIGDYDTRGLVRQLQLSGNLRTQFIH
jgi:hypothetical protein